MGGKTGPNQPNPDAAGAVADNRAGELKSKASGLPGGIPVDDVTGFGHQVHHLLLHLGWVGRRGGEESEQQVSLSLTLPLGSHFAG